MEKATLAPVFIGLVPPSTNIVARNIHCQYEQNQVLQGFHKVACRCEEGVPIRSAQGMLCPTKQSPRRLGDCSPALALARSAGASVTAFGGSQ